MGSREDSRHGDRRLRSSGDAARRERILVIVRDVAARGGAVDPGATLDEAGVDSLAFAELAVAVREELGVDLAARHVDGSERLDAIVAQALAAPAAETSALPRGLGALQGPAALVGGWALRWWCSLRVEGREHVPRRGPAVIAMNHESALDVPLVVVAAPRPIAFMAKRELFRGRGTAAALRGLGAFAVDRGRFDQPAIDAALEILRRGRVLGMYPEGTRAPGRLLPFQPGAAWLAVRTGAPIVPCSISGTERAGRENRGRVGVRIVFHEPIPAARTDDPAERRRLAGELTARLRASVEAGLHRAEAVPGP